MVPSLEIAALNLTVALICGALIGSERQVRQSMAGLRTNALVALGAAGFVLFSMLFTEELSPTRVGAQVVSGIGFLGAGIIFRHGFTVHGLNTAATLWASAAVGLLAGAGAHVFAVMMTAMLIFVNLGLRPLVRWIKRKTNAGVTIKAEVQVSLKCRPNDSETMRDVLVRYFAKQKAVVIGFGIDEESAENIVDLRFTAEVNEDFDSKKLTSVMLKDKRVLGIVCAESAGD